MSLTPANLEALTAFGYTPQEAHFLYLVATHSGYFRARQFLGFTGTHWSKPPTQFWSKLQRQKHARRECFPTYGLVYHVFARKLYRYLGRENLRNRCEHEIEYVQRRIDMFDFVLAHLDYDFLETEPEKVRFFVETCSVSEHVLPSRTYHGHRDAQPTLRYFVDRFPVFIARKASSPVVSFSYIQPPEANPTEFTRHVNQYLPLFRSLSAFRFLYLARSSSHFQKARELFDSVVTIPLESSPVADLLRYFAVRKAWDLRQYGSVSEADLIFRKQSKERFSAQRFEYLYRAWKAGRVTDDHVRQEFPANNGSHHVEFSAELLEAAGTSGATGEER